MIYSTLSVGEILRCSHPTTDLEKRLFDLLEAMHCASSDALRYLSADNVEGAYECLEAAECGQRWPFKQ